MSATRRPTPWRALIAALGLCSLTAMLAPSDLSAQKKPKGSLSGTVRAADGAPISDVLVRVTRDSLVYVARTDEDGRFLVPSIAAGRYALMAKRIGFEAASADVSIDDTRVRLDVAMSALTASVDTIRVRGSFTGVTGTVGDFGQMAPLAQATVRVLGGDKPLTTGDDGRFAIELEPGQSYALRVERPGFAPQLMSVELDEGGRVDLAVLLDSATKKVNDRWKWVELDQRLRVNRYAAARVARSELRGTEAGNLQLALQYAPSIAARGLTIPRRTCVFVDGVARPQLSVDAVPVSTVEFVEVYARGGDVSGTLATRWPLGYACTASENINDRTPMSSSRGAVNQAQYVLIWTRAP